MKRCLILFITALLSLWTVSPGDVFAQTETPPPSGEVSGKIINQNQGTVVTQSLEVMLHIWDKDYVDINMLHGRSEPDGTFRFTEVALQPEYLYAVMATYDDVAYFSETVPPEAGLGHLELDVPVYETTTGTSALQIDQLHVLFDFAQDGMETTEIYILSNLGERTVKGAVTLEGGALATLRYPLPQNADFIFFEPEQQDRFVKFPGGYVDTYPLLPGERSDQHMVKYLVPFSQGQTYTYTAPLNIRTMNLLLPENTGVSLKGEGLAGPQPVTLESGTSYIFYSYEDIRAGQTIRVAFSGKPALRGSAQSSNQTLPLALGGGLLGLVMIAVGVWWWRRPGDVSDEDDEMDAEAGEPTFDELIDRIARLDEAHERGKMDEEPYRRERTRLRNEAKRMLDLRGEHS